LRQALLPRAFAGEALGELVEGERGLGNSQCLRDGGGADGGCAAPFTRVR